MKAFKKIFSLLFVLGFSFTIYAQQVTTECISKELKAEIKPLLKPDYKYDSAKTIRFTYKGKKQLKEIEVPLFIGEKYKFIFNLKGAQGDVDINVYNKKVGAKKRKLLFSLKEVKESGKTVYTWEPTKSRKVYVDCTIPESKKEELRGCVLFMLGYKM